MIGAENAPAVADGADRQLGLGAIGCQPLREKDAATAVPPCHGPGDPWIGDSMVYTHRAFPSWIMK